MWKKIRSNRNPEHTVYSEIRKEFDPYFEKGRHQLRRFLEKSPKWIFGLMMLFIAASLVLTFTIFRHPEKEKVSLKPPSVIHDGFDQILRAGAQLKETIRLKKIVDSISAKKPLSPTDSLGLVQALDSLQKIHPKLN
jgi:hypothetical protein